MLIALVGAAGLYYWYKVYKVQDGSAVKAYSSNSTDQKPNGPSLQADRNKKDFDMIGKGPSFDSQAYLLNKKRRNDGSQGRSPFKQ